MVTYVKVPFTNSEKSFNQYCTWLNPLLKVVARIDGNEAGATHQITRTLVPHDRQAVVAGLTEAEMKIVQPMDPISKVAMWAAARVASRKSRRMCWRHLRHQLGEGAFAAEQTVMVMALNKGYVPAETSSAKYEKEDGKTPDDIPYSIKDAAQEVDRLATSVMEVDNLPGQVRRIDVTSGGDHGQGALQLGIHVTMVVTNEKKLEDSDNDDDKSITLQSIVAEAICKKDNAAILKLAVNDSFVASMRDMATSNLKMARDEQGKVQGTLAPLTRQSTATTLKVNLYVTSDIAFYGMAMGRESMMGDWYYLCRLKHAQFRILLSGRDDWDRNCNGAEQPKL